MEPPGKPGRFNAKTRTELLNWLSDARETDTCRILSNARCLSEGVDVPALDAILFLHPRKSQIDVVQSVGRVMRRAPGKKLGYVILPVGIPAGMSPEDALNDNESYRVVWQILNALRSHDDRFDANINKLDLGVDVSRHIEVIAETENLPTKQKDPQGPGIGEGGADYEIDPGMPKPSRPEDQIQFIFDEMPAAIRAKIVQKCGRRDYWEDWAKDIAKIAQKHITRIRSIIDGGDPERAVFDEFLEEVRDDLNEGVTEDEAIEMLAQHLITKPVFDALFKDYDFARENPVSQAMQTVLDVLEPKHLEKEAESLEGFYASVGRRASGIDNAEGKQKIIVELYEKFFRTAFPRMTQRLGIVYTPVEIVDFINHSVNEILQDEFGQTLGSKGVHIIDPFAGTGTFITRLLQSGLIKPEELAHKYRHEIHANEIILLAYYIAAVNIEAAYHGVAGGGYTPFEGICLTDTFQMYESGDMIDRLMPDNSERRKRQKAADIRVIVGNPPYSAGQADANDNAANQNYLGLDARIEETYAANSSATLQRGLYDSYIRAVRWGSDRLGEDGGVMAYVSNAGWIEGNAMDGLRQCLAEEFSSLYIFHLRGNARTQGEQRRKEKGNVFGEGTRTPVAITLHVKNPAATEHGKIHFHDIGDYLSREEKLSIIRNFGSIQGIARKADWKIISPDENNDWLNQGDPSFELFAPLGTKKDRRTTPVFRNYSNGVKTNRDFWCYNFSQRHLSDNISSTIAFYNDEVRRYQIDGNGRPAKDFVNLDSKRISWDRAERQGVEKGRFIRFSESSIVISMYRPFTKEWMYFDRQFNNCVYQIPRIFPDANARNMVICVTGIGANTEFSVFMTDTVPDVQLMANGQCFPLKLYEEADRRSDDILAGEGNKHQVRDGITNEALEYFKAAYTGEAIRKEDIFYYIYGLLHSPDYSERFENNLSKQLPRIPAVKRFEDFQAFTEAGRELAELHVNYESVEPYPVTIAEGDLRLANIDDPESFYRVKKMKVAGKRGSEDWTTVRYNENITMTDIPLEAWDYVVNGKPALKWVMERQQIKTDKKSGITNDPNRYAVETVGNPAYPLELFQRVITVSLETMKIVRSLPKMDIGEE
jgi:predicted helicase